MYVIKESVSGHYFEYLHYSGVYEVDGRDYTDNYASFEPSIKNAELFENRSDAVEKIAEIIWATDYTDEEDLYIEEIEL